MDKQEFLDALRHELAGQVTQPEVHEHIRYYDQYFREEMQKGRTCEEIIGALGTPMMVAKAILATEGVSSGMSQAVYEENQDYRSRQEHERSRRHGFYISYEDGRWDIGYGRFRLNSWYGKLLGAVLIIVLVTLLIQIVGVILSLMIPVLLILFLVFLFTGRRS